MSTLLYLPVSARGAASHSRKVGDAFCVALSGAMPGLRIVTRDLGAAPPPAPEAAFVAAMLKSVEARDAGDNARLVYSEQLIGELEAADSVLIATPVHNFTVPTALKAWIDHVVRINRTFRNSPEGKIGLLRDRPVRVIAASGGRFGPDAPAQQDFFAPYLSYLFSTVGIFDVDFLRMELLTRGPEPLTAAYAKAESWTAQQVAKLTARLAPA